MKLIDYCHKMRGGVQSKPPRASTSDLLWAWLGACLGMGAVALLSEHFFAPHDWPLLIGSLGASAALLYGAMHSPFAQPRNLLGGHLLSALVGVLCWQALGAEHLIWAETLSVACAIAVMQLTHTLHPPGGATALLAIIGSEKIHALGFWYVLLPATLGPLILLLVALLINNLVPGKRYPLHWF